MSEARPSTTQAPTEEGFPVILATESALDAQNLEQEKAFENTRNRIKALLVHMETTPEILARAQQISSAPAVLQVEDSEDSIVVTSEAGKSTIEAGVSSQQKEAEDFFAHLTGELVLQMQRQATEQVTPYFDLVIGLVDHPMHGKRARNLMEGWSAVYSAITPDSLAAADDISFVVEETGRQIDLAARLIKTFCEELKIDPDSLAKEAEVAVLLEQRTVYEDACEKALSLNGKIALPTGVLQTRQATFDNLSAVISAAFTELEYSRKPTAELADTVARIPELQSMVAEIETLVKQEEDVEDLRNGAEATYLLLFSRHEEISRSRVAIVWSEVEDCYVRTLNVHQSFLNHNAFDEKRISLIEDLRTINQKLAAIKERLEVELKKETQDAADRHFAQIFAFARDLVGELDGGDGRSIQANFITLQGEHRRYLDERRSPDNKLSEEQIEERLTELRKEASAIIESARGMLGNHMMRDLNASTDKLREARDLFRERISNLAPGTDEWRQMNEDVRTVGDLLFNGSNLRGDIASFQDALPQPGIIKIFRDLRDHLEEFAQRSERVAAAAQIDPTKEEEEPPYSRIFENPGEVRRELTQRLASVCNVLEARGFYVDLEDFSIDPPHLMWTQIIVHYRSTTSKLRTVERMAKATGSDTLEREVMAKEIEDEIPAFLDDLRAFEESVQRGEIINEESFAAEPPAETPSLPPERILTPEDIRVNAVLEEKLVSLNLRPWMLDRAPGFYALSGGQKLLVVENLKQLTLGRIQEEALEQYRSNSAQASWLGKIWLSFSEYYQIAKLEKEEAHRVLTERDDQRRANYHKQVLTELVRGAQAGPEVKIGNDGKTPEVQFTPTLENLSLEQKSMLAVFNDDANNFCRIPEKWGQKEATFSEKRKYNKAYREYKASRDLLLSIVGRKINSSMRAMAIVNEIDGNILLNRFLNSNPDAEEEIQKRANDSALRRSLASVFTRKGIIAGSGYIGRSAAVGILAGLAVPLSVAGASAAIAAGMVTGGGLAYGFAKKSLRERDVMARKGVKDTSKESRKMYNATEMEESLSRLIDASHKETDPEKKRKIMEALEIRIYGIQNYIENGRINFGDVAQRGISVTSVDKRLAHQYSLIRTLAAARVHYADMRQNVYSRRSRKASLLHTLQQKGEQKNAAARKKYFSKKIRRGAVIGAVTSAAGVLIQWWDSLPKTDD